MKEFFTATESKYLLAIASLFIAIASLFILLDAFALKFI